MLNHIVLMGRLTADPELKQTKNGVAVASFTLAVDHDRKDKETGERGTDFIRCVAWRNTAEFTAKYFSKGQMAALAGRLSVRVWTDDEDKRRTTTEVMVSDIYFADSRKKDGAASQAGMGIPEIPDIPASDYALLEDDDEPLPF